MTNYYAPLLSKEGLTQPDTQRKYGEHKKMINITEEEMALFIYRIQRTMECFEDNVFHGFGDVPRCYLCSKKKYMNSNSKKNTKE